mgnify:CR=1 FL=1
MKIIRDNKVYVQKRDLGLIFGKPFDVSYYIDVTLGIDFVEIEDEEIKNKVKEASFVLDYDEFINKSIEEILKKQNLINSEIISLSLKSQKINDKDSLEKINFECKKLINLSNELLCLLLIKEGKIILEIPSRIVRKR